MKKIIPFLALAILISSCGNKMTLLKRHYTKGYYVQNSSRIDKMAPDKAAKFQATNMERVGPRFVKEVKQPVVTASIKVNSDEKIAWANYPKQMRKEAMAGKKLETGSIPVITLNKRSSENRFANENKRGGGGDVSLVILVLLSIFIPPLAVYLKNGETNKWFWVTLILCLLAFTYFVFVFGGSLWFVAFLIAILYVFDIIK